MAPLKPLGSTPSNLFQTAAAFAASTGSVSILFDFGVPQYRDGDVDDESRVLRAFSSSSMRRY